MGSPSPKNAPNMDQTLADSIFCFNFPWRFLPRSRPIDLPFAYSLLIQGNHGLGHSLFSWLAQGIPPQRFNCLKYCPIIWCCSGTRPSRSGARPPGEKVTVTFSGQSKTTEATSAGDWRIALDPLAANAEPRTLTVQGSNKIEIRDVLVGEVWLCSGQSNMFLPLLGEKFPPSVDGVRDQEAIAAADHPRSA